MNGYYKVKAKKAASKQSKLLVNHDLFDYKTLVQPIPYDPEEQVIDNNLYGYAHHLKRFAHITKDLKAYVEHGIFLGGMIHKDEKHWFTKKVVTFSKWRAQSIENKLPHHQAIAVGPYIHYAPLLFNKSQRSSIKDKLGKTLLVFPSHSINNVEAQFNIDSFIKEINSLKSAYDTVLISLYFLDAQNPETISKYENQGFKIVTSGHKFDHNFIARQKTIISLADMTISNSFGTHIGYCTYMEKPHYIFDQGLKYKGTTAKEQKRFDSIYESEEAQIAQKEKEMVTKIYNVYLPEIITQEQRDIASEMWGFNDIKTPEELKDIFK